MVDVTSLGDNRYSVSDGTRRRLAYATGTPKARWVFIEGRVYVIDVSRPGPFGTSRPGPFGPGRSTHDEETALASPMPATVASIHAAAGQEVSQGDVLVMLEAMKMELPIRAPRSGRVKTVTCRRGELVQPGVPLVELE